MDGEFKGVTSHKMEEKEGLGLKLYYYCEAKIYAMPMA